MKKWLVLIVSILFLGAALILLWRFPVRNIINTQHENNEKILELEEKIITIKNQFDLLEPIISLWEEKVNDLSENNEKIDENKNTQEKIVSAPKDTNSTINEVKEITTETNSSTTTIIKKIWYITKVSQENSIAKISFDEIVILPNQDCEWQICFKNENTKTSTFILSDKVEIYSYFINYLIGGEIRKSKKILLPCFLEFFAEDDADDYTRFNKIPYWITLENGKIIKIDEQNVVGLYE